MTGMIDIARSSLSAYRTALGTVGENIANVNTQGYVKRDVVQVEMAGSQTTPTTMATFGQGVQVTDVRRAFDDLLANRLRSATGDVSAASAQLAGATQVESLMMPGTGGVDQALTKFFSAIGSLQSSPATGAIRRTVLETGAGLAGAVKDVAAGLTRLRGDTLAATKLTAGQINTALSELAEVNIRIPGLSGSPGAANPILDARDRLLDQLSGLVGMTASLDSFGRARVTLGDSGAGAVLLDGAGPVTVTAVDGQPMTLNVQRDGKAQDFLLPDAGMLGGQARALGAIDGTMTELDSFARRIAADMNAVHRSGLDQTGAAGGDMFRLQGWQVQAAPVNQGSAQINITPTSDVPYAGKIALTYDAAAGAWMARDADTDAALGSGATRLSLQGMTIDLAGQPKNGDRLVLSPRLGSAADLSFVLTETTQIAAAGGTVVAAAAGNAGNASLSIAALPVADLGLPALGAALPVDGTAASGISLLAAGVVGMIPAGTKSVSLASLGQQALLDIPLTAANLGAATTLTLPLSAGAETFALQPLPAGADTVAGLAAALNAGQILSASGQSLAQLGVQASGQEGQLTLALGAGDFAAGGAITGGGLALAGFASPAQAAGGTVQIFTREGRQIAGTPLSASDAATLLTTANGFATGAVYRADYLNGATGTAYRGMSLQSVQVPGAQVLDLPPAAGPAVWTAASGVAPAATPARTLTLEAPPAVPLNVALPAGTTAQGAASLLNAARPGLSAKGETALMMAAPAADGKLSFALTGNNLAPVTISADVAGGRMDALVQAVNAATGATGIRAELSPQGDRMLLVQDAGANIGIAGLSHAAGAAVTLTQTDAAGQPLDGMAPVTLGAGGPDSLRATGVVTLQAASGFSLTPQGAARMDSTTAATAGGLISATASEAGATQTLRFAFDPAIDGKGISADGTTPLAGPTRYTVALGGQSVTLDPAVAGVQDAAGVARAMAGLLRAEGPVASLTGGAVASLPKDGTSLSLRLDGQDYTLRMQSGAVVVDGPEAGRIAASFGPDNRLRLTATDGVTDGAALALPTGSATALAAFGFGASAAAQSTLTGRPQTVADLPAGGVTLNVSLGGVAHQISVQAAGGQITASASAGFAGQVSVDPATGALHLTAPASAGALKIEAPGGAGMAAMGATVAVTDGALVMRTTDGAALQMTADATSLATQRTAMIDLPPEDLIVVMSGAGALRMAGSMVAGSAPTAAPALTLRMADATSGAVEMLDSKTGQSIGTRYLDASGSAEIGGYAVSIKGAAVTGDSFTLAANTNGLGDARNADRLHALQSRDAATGKGGFADMLASIQSGTGSRVSAATTRQSTAAASEDALNRALSEVSAVDLDAEAAKLIQLQQGYQASAQMLSIAKSLFDTLLQTM